LPANAAEIPTNATSNGHRACETPDHHPGDAIMRWIMLAVSLLGFVISFGTQSVGVLVLGLLLALGGMVGAVFAFAAARVESVSQAQSSRELSVLLDAKKLNVAPEARAKPAQLPAQPAARPPARHEQQRAERGVEIDFRVGAYSTAGAKSGNRTAHERARSDTAGDSGGTVGGSGGD